MLKSKTNAFTLVEMLVVLVLSSIIVSIIYVAYFTITRYQVDLSRKQKRSEDLTSLYYLLKRDIHSSVNIEAVNDLSLNCSGKINILYQFTSTYTVRMQESRVDTFYVQVTAPLFLWKTLQLTTFPSKVDQIELDVQGVVPGLQMNIKKKYSAADLVETVKDSLP
ncbi:prepilin-type N-terminal cleavage/methylation domain-containing protein [Fulvivirgaceae bacterium PWU20]|uniref:Prepilin-type N-terminal cleavage/methylation domain-containing protein n=2 Tax=Chryseosolibacter indicus TaxID=2782351 RepID=A0ABS5VWE9_9BACT|nr:prepilin-type N-terminal cleavage/methylation domain-containing protein [Chryseosolibacter indicus]